MILKCYWWHSKRLEGSPWRGDSIRRFTIILFVLFVITALPLLLSPLYAGVITSVKPKLNSSRPPDDAMFIGLGALYELQGRDVRYLIAPLDGDAVARKGKEKRG